MDTHIYLSVRKREFTIVTKATTISYLQKVSQVYKIVSSFYHLKSNHNEKGPERQLNACFYNGMKLGKKKKGDHKFVDSF